MLLDVNSNDYKRFNVTITYDCDALLSCNNRKNSLWILITKFDFSYSVIGKHRKFSGGLDINVPQKVQQTGIVLLFLNKHDRDCKRLLFQ